MMSTQFSIGDKVSLLNSPDDGIVIGFAKNGDVIVEIEGFDNPYPINELVKRVDFTKASKERKIVDAPIKKPSLDIKGLYLSFVANIEKVNSQFTHLDVELLNFSNDEINLIITQSFDGKHQVFFNGNLLAGTQTIIKSFTAMDSPSSFQFTMLGTVLPSTGNLFSSPVPFIINEKVKLSSILNLSKFNALYGKAAYLLKLMLPSEKEQNKEGLNKLETKLPKYLLADVIDLHLDKITDANTYLKVKNNALEFQLQHLRDYIQMALIVKKTSLVFIHGIGDGVLRSAIHQYLSERNDIVSYFRMGDSNKYGFNGATEVFFIV